jgi:hypothetical protein
VVSVRYAVAMTAASASTPASTHSTVRAAGGQAVVPPRRRGRGRQWPVMPPRPGPPSYWACGSISAGGC